MLFPYLLLYEYHGYHTTQDYTVVNKLLMNGIQKCETSLQDSIIKITKSKSISDADAHNGSHQQIKENNNNISDNSRDGDSHDRVESSIIHISRAKKRDSFQRNYN